MTHHPAFYGFLIGYVAGCMQCAAIAYLLVERAKRRAAKPGNN